MPSLGTGGESLQKETHQVCKPRAGTEPSDGHWEHSTEKQDGVCLCVGSLTRMISWEVLGIFSFTGRVIFISKFQRKKEECSLFLSVERILNFFTRAVGESLKRVKAQV